jgi:dTDP-4-amino-4,6-dideoxygalactose transaminase
MEEFKRFEEKVWLSCPTIHGEEQEFIQEAFDTNWVAPLGKNVNEFEKELAAFVGVREGAAMVSGTSALHMAVKMAGIRPGSIVFCSDLTFAATVNPVSYEGGTQVFIDSEEDTWNMDPKALEKAFSLYRGQDAAHPKPTAVVLAHLYGTPAKIDEILEICRKYQVPLIEDAAESLSATYKGKQTGSFGKWAGVSFNGNKIITSSGGGMFLSDDVEAVKKVRFYSTQAREPFPYYQHKEIGYNYRMSNIVAGIGRGQLLHLQEHRDKKEAIYKRYEAGLAGLPLSMNPYDRENSRPNFWLSCIRFQKDCGRDPEALRLFLDQYNVESRPIWKPMHLQPVYQNRAFITAEGQDVGGAIFREGLCLPSDIKMTPQVQDTVIRMIRSFMEG